MKRLVIAPVLGAAALLASWAHLRSSAGERAGDLGAAPATPPMVSLPSPAAPGSAEPNLAVAPDGRVYMSWFEPADSGHALRVASLSGATWTAPRTVRAGTDFFVNWADFPSVLPLGDGRLAAHWLQRTGKQTYAYGVRLAFSADDGRTWSPALRPHTDSANREHGFVSLWRTGEVVEAVWLDGRKFGDERSPRNEMTVASAGFRADGTNAVPEATLDGRTCDCCQTAAALTSEGPVVVYRDRSPDEIRDMYVVRRVGDGRGGRRWTEPVPLHRDGWKLNYCPVNGPSIDARQRDLAVAWFTGANDTARVNVAFSRDAGASFTPPVRVDGGTPAGRVDVVLTREGDALVSWVERTGGDTAAVQVRRVRADGRSGSPMTITSSSAARASGFPRMVLAGDDVVFAWTVPGRPSQVRLARVRAADVR